MKRISLLAFLVTITVAACGQGPDLDIRTFNLTHRSGYEASEIILPYVFTDREGAAGSMSATSGAISVRETRDNLDKIARVLAEFDQPPRELRLRFQLIEADSYQDQDPEIEDVVGELRDLFRFDGYRLAGEAMVNIADEGNFSQSFMGADGGFAVRGAAEVRAPGAVRLHDVSLLSPEGPLLETTVNASVGQTVVIGGGQTYRSERSFILTVRIEEG